jgi:hypothetical protein
LFDGTDLSQWEGGEDWKIENGAATTVKRSIQTKQAFGDCQLHVEFATPTKIEGSGQGRGNSGIFFGGSYEVQVLDSYDNVTYFDGQCGALYKQSPPIVNPCRKPGEWQTYDIVYEAPRFGAYGEVTSPAYLTVLLNGVLVQNHVALKGGTFYNKPPGYTPLPVKMPIQLQFHGNDTQFRNIWIRENIAQHQPVLPEAYQWQSSGDEKESTEEKPKEKEKGKAEAAADSGEAKKAAEPKKEKAETKKPRTL